MKKNKNLSNNNIFKLIQFLKDNLILRFLKFNVELINWQQLILTLIMFLNMRLNNLKFNILKEKRFSQSAKIIKKKKNISARIWIA